MVGACSAAVHSLYGTVITFDRLDCGYREFARRITHRDKVFFQTVERYCFIRAFIPLIVAALIVMLHIPDDKRADTAYAASYIVELCAHLIERVSQRHVENVRFPDAYVIFSRYGGDRAVYGYIRRNTDKRYNASCRIDTTQVAEYPFSRVVAVTMIVPVKGL